ncbi:MAG: n-acetylglutamate synthase [Campylobacterota bacterium]|nr:n-acetylglutamate synthase [Campylobacterota bacterium]
MINLDKKIFQVLSNPDNGEVSDDTTFYYSQKNNIISAEYNGGDILKGNLIGKQLEDGRFDFVYHHINVDSKLKIGKCLSNATLLDDGKIKLQEEWQWLCDDLSTGISELIEIDYM